MTNEQFPFLLIEQNKAIQEDESDFSEDKKDRKNKKYDYKKYEKFKPKNQNRSSKGQIYLEGAENQVKSMLSLFLKDIQQENSEEIDNNKFISKINSKDNNIHKRRTAKLNSVASTNFNFGRLKFHNNYNKNINNNINNNINKVNTGTTLIFQMNNQKKDIKNINFFFNNNNYNEGSPYRNKRSSINFTSSSPKNKNSLFKRISLNTSNIWNDSQRRKSRNKYRSSLNGSNVSPSPKKSKFYDKISFNDSINNLIRKDNEYENSDELKNKKDIKTKNSIHKRKYGSISSLSGGLSNQINSNLAQKKKYSNQKDNFMENKFFLNNSKKSVNDIYKNPNNNTIISVSSEWKSIAEINKDESNTLGNNVKIDNANSKALLNRYNTVKEDNDFIRKNSPMNTVIMKSKSNNELINLKRINSHNSEDKLKYLNNNKFQLRTIKKILRNSIILRPEDIKLNTKSILEKNRGRKNLNNSSKNVKNKKLKGEKSKSGINLLKIDKKRIILEKLNKSDIARKNNSSINNIKVIVTKNKKEKVKKISDKKLSKKEVKFIEEKQTHEQEKENSLKNTPSLKKKNAVSKYRVLKRRQNLYDSLDDEECEDAEEINHLFIHPNSNFILFFDSVLIFSSLISFISVPLYLAKTHSFCRSPNIEAVFVINIFIEFLNVADLLLNFFRGYYNWEEQLIYRKRKIIIHYLEGWFLFDLISAIPVYTINKFHEPDCDKYVSTKYYNQILNNPHYLFLSNRLFKILKIFYNNQAYKIFSKELNEYIKMTINIAYVFLGVNYVGCLYIFIARNNYPNWILKTNLNTSSFGDIYITSIYILIMAMTTVGYGDITCYSFWERIFQLYLLVVGIFAYSWAVTSFSNYVKKISEKSADFEKKKRILDEIKLSNQNLPDELYDKIVRHLKFKYYHEKKLKSIIFDCLPVSLKNSLICEMYKPIIRNFIFFKNFQNTDFIVRVILVFRPIIADKNDILINDNDMVEDIMFVKHGILSVELPINVSNPNENIDRYKNMSILNDKKPEIEKEENTTILYSKINCKLNNNINNSQFKNTIPFLDSNKNNSLSKQPMSFNSAIFGSGIGSNIMNSTLAKKITLSEKEKEKEKDIIRYVRILCIRENEHFGDVMMFLEKRSPLRVRVKSKKAELFFLKKMDAIKISTSYPNIWRRINKRSVFNFEQIKKSINKIIEIYCSVKRLHSIDEEENSNSGIYSELMKKSKLGKDKTEINMRPKKYELNNVIDKNNCSKRSHSISNNINSNSIKKLINKNKIEKISDKNILRKLAKSSKKVIRNINIDKNSKQNEHIPKKKKTSIMSPKNKVKKCKKKVTFDKKLDDIFQEKYKFYKKMNKTQIKKDTIINEEPSNEDNFSYLRSTKSFKNISKISLSSSRGNTSNNKKNIIQQIESQLKNEDKDINNNYNRYISDKNNNLYKNKNTKSMKTIKLDDSSSMQLINDESINMDLGEIEGNIINNFAYDKIINNEIYPGEEININKGEDLFLKKYDILSPMKKNINKNEFNNSINEVKKRKIDYLLRSFDDSSEDKDKNININDDRIISENSPKSIKKVIIKNSGIDKELVNEKIIIQKKAWNKKSLAVFSNISFKYDSSYENSNLICGQKLIKNRINQFKLKKFLIEEILNKNSSTNRSSFYQLSCKKLSNISPYSQLNSNNSTDIAGKEIKIINKAQSSSILNKQLKKKLRRCESHKDIPTVHSTNNKASSIKRTSSFNGNIFQKNKKIKNPFQDELNDTNINNHFNLFQRKITKLPNNNNLISKNTYNSSNEKNKKTAAKKSSIVSPKTKKKTTSTLLSKISFNIQKTNQNLNNPEEFYSNYFNSILEGDMTAKNISRGISMKALPKIKKEKGFLK